MNLILQRTHIIENSTFGTLVANGQFICYTLEDLVREKAGQSVAVWKVHGATAIPSGVYRVTLESSPRFGPETLTVNAVPGFTGVRMHAGNTVDDTEGCPLLGTSIDTRGIVPGTSRAAVGLVREAVRHALACGERVFMEVRNPPGYVA